MKQLSTNLAYLSRSALVLLILSFSSALVLAQGDTNLVGTWQSKVGNASITLILNADGTGKLDEAAIKYAVTGNKLRVNEAGAINDYTFSLRGNTLTVSGVDLEQPLVFERQTTTGKGLGARRNQLAASAGDSGPVGAWESRTGQAVLRMELNPDGTGTFNDLPLKWKFDKGVLIFISGGTTLNYAATIEANSIEISGGNPPKITHFERVERQAGSTASEKKQPRSSESGLTGHWQSREYTLEISENGTVSINGEPFRYSVRGNIITLSNNEGSVQIPFQLDGDTLVTTFQGQRTVYTRGSESGAAMGTGGGANSAELAGKWCYMANVNANNGGRMSNRCITLYANGTYEYYSETSSSNPYGSTASQDSDSGTWRATATSITANSRKHGVLTYSLEKRNHPKTGDPMIVLDGDAYVTYQQRRPW